MEPRVHFNSAAPLHSAPPTPTHTLPLSGFPAGPLATPAFMHKSNRFISNLCNTFSLPPRAALQSQRWISTPSVAGLISQDAGDGERDGERGRHRSCVGSPCHAVTQQSCFIPHSLPRILISGLQLFTRAAAFLWLSSLSRTQKYFRALRDGRRRDCRFILKTHFGTQDFGRAATNLARLFI